MTFKIVTSDPSAKRPFQYFICLLISINHQTSVPVCSLWMQLSAQTSYC